MSNAPDQGRDLSTLREEAAPEVVRRAFRRFKRRLLVLGVVAALAGGGVAYYFAGIRPGSDIPSLERMVGEENGPFHLIAQERLGDEVWRMYAYRDQGGWPCMVGTLGGGGCYPYAGRVKGEIGDHQYSGGSWTEPDGAHVEFLVVEGTVPRDVQSVVIELSDGTTERAETIAVPEFEERFFAVLIDEGSSEREVVDLREPRS